MSIEFNIIYTSDTHGRLSAYDFMYKSYGNFGLSRLSSYLKSLQKPYILLDNGDFLQGSPLLDFARKNKLENPAALMFNAIGHDYVTVGNHDFNFGMDYLKSFQSTFNHQILCANITKNGNHFFKPYIIHDIAGVKVAIIGLTTEYIPFWERKENIEGLDFLDVVKVTEDMIENEKLKDKADLIVLLYHGGYEKNPSTNEVYGRQTIENKGNQLFNIKDVDIVLTGHQHIAQIHQKDHKVTMQISHNAKDFGVIHIEVEEDKNKRLKLVQVRPEILTIKDYPVDIEKENVIHDLITKTDQYLSQKIGLTVTDMSIKSPLEARVKKHPLFQLINQIQLSYTKADLSCASLPNETNGFPREITLNDIAVNFPFENDMVVLEITGKILLDALEQNSTYFDIDKNEVMINKKFLFPKVEHYNYDVYDGVSYDIVVKNPIGRRIQNVIIKNKQLELDKTYRLVLNSYRATGAGGFDMFKQARVIESYPVSYFELISDFVIKNQAFNIDVVHNFKVIF